MRVSIAAGACLAMLLGACGGTPARDRPKGNPIVIEGVDLPGLDQLPAAQRAAFEDGTVTTVEYSTAYRAFEACANSGGREAVVDPQVDPVSGYISYGIFEDVGGSLEDPLSDSGRCYENEFRWIEVVWELTDPTYKQQIRERDLAQFESEARPCLVANGVDVSAEVEYASDEYGQLLRQWAELANAGKC